MESSRKIVADTSAVLAVCLEEETRHEIIEQTKGSELIAPQSLPTEVPNALSSKFKQGKLDLNEALAVIRRFENIPIQQVPVDLRAATRLSHELDIYAYDAYMIQVAQHHRCSIISLDGGLCEAAERAGVDIIEVT